MESLKALIELLGSEDFLVGDEDIDIAKGKYQSPTNWSEFKNAIKRK